MTDGGDSSLQQTTITHGAGEWIDYLQGLAILNNCMADDKAAMQAGTQHLLRSKKLLQQALAVCRYAFPTSAVAIG